MNYTKHTKEHKNTKVNNQQGQALLFVVVAMTIALSIGINASVRTITSLSRTTRTDTAARALAAAEGGIERYIALSTQELEAAVGYTQEGSDDCPVGENGSLDSTNYCRVDFEVESITGDILTSQAFVSVERYENITEYPFTLESGQVKEINLYDFTASPVTYYPSTDVEICWSGGSDLLYTSYTDTGVQARGGLPGNPRPAGAYNSEGFSCPNAGTHSPPHDRCCRVSIGTDIYGLRIRALGSDADVSVYPVDGNTLPLQGYRITSIGKLAQDQQVVATRIIRIIRTLPYLPIGFDHALYSRDPIGK